MAFGLAAFLSTSISKGYMAVKVINQKWLDEKKAEVKKKMKKKKSDIDRDSPHLSIEPG